MKAIVYANVASTNDLNTVIDKVNQHADVLNALRKMFAAACFVSAGFMFANYKASCETSKEIQALRNEVRDLRAKINEDGYAED